MSLNDQELIAGFEKIIGKTDMNYVENYNASEGYFGLQDQKDSKDLLLLTNSEVFFEFIPMTSFEGLASTDTSCFTPVCTAF